MYDTGVAQAEDPLFTSSLGLSPHSAVLKVMPWHALKADTTVSMASLTFFQTYYTDTQVQELLWVASVYGSPLASRVFLMIGVLFLDWFHVRGSY